MTYDQDQLDALFLRAKAVLGQERWQILAQSKPRRDAFTTTLSKATKAMGGPAQVTDEQIIGALENADEVFPVELGVVVCVFRRIRPPIPITFGHLFRSIRPPVMSIGIQS